VYEALTQAASSEHAEGWEHALADTVRARLEWGAVDERPSFTRHMLQAYDARRRQTADGLVASTV
jgi:hypothetical protein